MNGIKYIFSIGFVMLLLYGFSCIRDSLSEEAVEKVDSVFTTVDNSLSFTDWLFPLILPVAVLFIIYLTKEKIKAYLGWENKYCRWGWRIWSILASIVLFIMYYGITMQQDFPYINACILFLVVFFFLLIVISPLQSKTLYKLDLFYRNGGYFWLHLCIPLFVFLSLIFILIIIGEIRDSSTLKVYQERSHIIYNASKNILMNPQLNDSEKKDQLHNIFSLEGEKVYISISTNNGNYVYKDFSEQIKHASIETDQKSIKLYSYAKINYLQENEDSPIGWGKGYEKHFFLTRYLYDRNSTYVGFPPIEINGDRYYFTYEIALYNPVWHIFYPITLSVIDKERSQKYITSGAYKEFFFFYFWAIPIVILISYTIFQYYYNRILKSAYKKIGLQLEEAYAHLVESNNKLSIWKDTYNRIVRDYKNNSEESQQNIQYMYADLSGDLKNASSLSRHDLINNLRTHFQSITDYKSLGFLKSKSYTEALAVFKDFIAEIDKDLQNNQSDESNFTFRNMIYKFWMNPWVERLRQELLELDKSLDIRCTDEPIMEVISAMHNNLALPNQLSPEKIGRVRNQEFNIEISDNFDSTKMCNVNLDKVSRITHNLLDNALQAMTRYKNNIEDIGERRKWIRRLSMSIYEGNSDDGRLGITLRIQDNGGGFPDDVIDKIYHESIRTTKDDRKFGEGTSYVGFFVSMMEGTIKAENTINDLGEKGAVTTVFFPYKDFSFLEDDNHENDNTNG